MDKLLHRGKYLVKEEYKVVNVQPARGLKMLGMGKEFSRADKIIYIATYVWIFLWASIFIVGTIYNLTHDVADLIWMKILVYLSQRKYWNFNRCYFLVYHWWNSRCQIIIFQIKNHGKR